MRRIGIFALVALSLTGTATAQLQNTQTNRTYDGKTGQQTSPQINHVAPAEMVQKVEAAMVMPEGAAPLAEYDRFYGIVDFWAPNGSKPQGLDAIYLHKSTGWGPQVEASPIVGIPGAFAIPKDGYMPVVEGGGCNIVWMMLDAKTLKPKAPGGPMAKCNPPSKN